MNRSLTQIRWFAIVLFMVSSFEVCATVAPIVPGQSLWWIVQRIGLEVDAIESKLDLLDTSTISGSCGIVELSQSSVVGGVLSIASPGSYCLTENITANITISSSYVLLDLNGRCITGTIAVSSGSYFVIQNGFVNPTVPSSAPSAGIDVATGVTNLFMQNVTVTCADSAAGGGIAGRTAVQVDGTDIQIKHCFFTAGAGGSKSGSNAGAGGHALQLTDNARDVVLNACILIGGDGGDNSVSGNGGSGGHGIVVAGATDVLVDDCTIFRTGDGGSGVSTGGDGGHGIACITNASSNVFVKDCTIQKTGGGGGASEGGDGGHGVYIAGVSNMKVAISNCTISDMGAGGAGGGLGGGSGGSGVYIESSNTDISVHNCTISNTGVAGSGGVGVAGKAVADDVAAGAGASKTYANFAHDIANAIVYDLQGINNTESGFALSNPPSSTAVSVYANVFI